MCVNLTPLTSSVGSAHGRSLPTLLRNSLRNSSVLLPSPWGRSSNRERAIIIYVSINDNTTIFIKLIVILKGFLVLNFPSF